MFWKYLWSSGKAVFVGKKQVQQRVYRIGISPGHCPGDDPGAISATGQHEADLARVFAKQLYNRLKMNPSFSPVLYGMDEVKKNYAQRVADSNANKDDFYIPCHFNAGGAPNYNGWLILVDPEDVQKNANIVGLATSILSKLSAFENLGFADFDTKKDGVMAGESRPIYELAKPLAWTLYLELGFLSNKMWCMELGDELFMMKMANAVVDGLDAFLAVAGDSFKKA
jgi:N-acetylmuramoyl-L-alanine amidase